MTINTSGKRKKAIARATLRKGSGKVRINHQLLDTYTPKMYRLRIREPILLAGDIINGVDIDINVFGGGINSQADACRLSIAKAIVKYTKSDKLKSDFLKYDRN